MNNGAYGIVVSVSFIDSRWRQLNKSKSKLAYQWGKSKLYGLKTMDGDNKTCLHGQPECVREHVLKLLEHIQPGKDKVICFIHRSELWDDFWPAAGQSQAKLDAKKWANFDPQGTTEVEVKQSLSTYTNIDVWYFSKVGGTIAKALSDQNSNLYEELLKATTTYSSAPASAVLTHQIGKIVLPADMYLQGIAAAIEKSKAKKVAGDKDLENALKNTVSILCKMPAEVSVVFSKHKDACTDFTKVTRAFGKMSALVTKVKPLCNMKSLPELGSILQSKKKASTSFHDCCVALMKALEPVSWK